MGRDTRNGTVPVYLHSQVRHGSGWQWRFHPLDAEAVHALLSV